MALRGASILTQDPFRTVMCGETEKILYSPYLIRILTGPGVKVKVLCKYLPSSVYPKFVHFVAVNPTCIWASLRTL